MGEQGILDSYASSLIDWHRYDRLFKLADDTHIEPGVTTRIAHLPIPNAHSHTTLAKEVLFSIVYDRDQVESLVRK